MQRPEQRSRRNESGQTMVFLLLGLGIFLLAAVGFAVDVSNMWFHRQRAQNAADAACTAAIMDMLPTADGDPIPPTANFTPGTNFDCHGTTPNSDKTTAPVPCWYAAVNGYPAAGTPAPGNVADAVTGSFPSSASVPGVVTTPAISNPFIRIDVIDRVRVFLMALLTGSRTQDVRAFAICGFHAQGLSVPFVLLTPTGTALDFKGNASLAIVGGGQTTMQVNSNNSGAVSGSNIDLSLAGPGSCLTCPGTGGDIHIVSSQSNPGINLGSTGHWISNTGPTPDPLAPLKAPAIPSNSPLVNGYPKTVPQNTDGCLHTTCLEFQPGYYPLGITVGGTTAIFQPGIYYIDNGLTLGPNSCVQPTDPTASAEAAGDGSGGTLFYFADSNSFSVGSNAGKKCPSGFPTDRIKCTPSSLVPNNVPPTVDGSVLTGPCQAPTNNLLCAPNCSINYGDPLGTTNPIGEQRGVLFFQNRFSSVTADWSGGGQFLFAGILYFHQCVTAPPRHR